MKYPEVIHVSKQYLTDNLNTLSSVEFIHMVGVKGLRCPNCFSEEPSHGVNCRLEIMISVGRKILEDSQ